MMSTGIFINLNHFIAYDDEFNLDDYVRGVMDAGVFRGRRYIMPIEYAIPIMTTTQEMLDAEGITPADLRTFDGFIRVAKQFNERHSGNPDRSFLINWHFNFNTLFHTFRNSGIELIDYNTNTVAAIDKQRFQNVMDLVKAMYVQNEDREASSAIIGEAFSVGLSGQGLMEQRWLFNNTRRITGLLLFNEYRGVLGYGLTPLIFTFPDVNDGLTAEIIQFAAIPQASPNQINAWNFMRILLSADIQGGHADYGYSLPYLRLGLPVLKRSIRPTIKRDHFGLLDDDEERLNKYVEMSINVDSAQIIPRILIEFILDEMTPYFRGTRTFDDAFARLVNRLEIYVSE